MKNKRDRKKRKDRNDMKNKRDRKKRKDRKDKKIRGI